MKKTNKIRLLAFILTLCMMIGVLPLYVLADGTETELPEQITETTNENLTAFQLGLGEKSVAELENMTLSAADIPASITRETVEAKDHVLRLREQEADLNTVIFQNRDGGKTVYLFGSPVKYVDANGNIRDKSTTLVSENVTVNGKTYAHSATDNFFGQYYPTMPQNGVMLAFGPYTVEMKPVITGVLTLRDTVVADNKVTYNKVFGTGTSLVYTPTLNGVKEDIILQTYTGKSSFSFTIKTNGLAIVQDENDTFLADFEGNKVASLGDVIITDKVGKTTYGTMTVVTKAEREEYTVTVNAPIAFLTNPTTVYPVTVDPTVTIEEEGYIGAGDGDGAEWGTIIEDLCIYNGSENPYTNGGAVIGNYYYSGESDAPPDNSRMLFGFNSSYLNYTSLSNYINDGLYSASMYVRGNRYETDVAVNLYPCTTDWNSGMSSNAITELWNAYNSSYGDRSTVTEDSPSMLKFDVTSIFSYWAADLSQMYYGIMMIIDNEGYQSEADEENGVYDTDCYNQFYLYQTESGQADIYFSVDYGIFNGEYYIENKEKPKLISISPSGDVVQGILDRNLGDLEDFEDDERGEDSLERVKWKIEYVGENYYTIKSLHNNAFLAVANGSADNGTTIVTSNTLDDASKWKIQKRTSGAYTLSPKSSESNPMVISMHTSLENFFQYTYSNNNEYSDEWIIMEASESSVVSFLGVTASDGIHDHQSCFSTAMFEVSKLGYKDIHCVITTGGIAISECSNTLNKSDIFVSRSHGVLKDNPKNNDNIVESAIVLNDFQFQHLYFCSEIYDFENSNSNIELTNIKVAMFIACYTASGGTSEGARNFVTAAVKAGADCAIGCLDSVGCSDGSRFVEYFFEAYGSGLSAYNSFLFAQTELYNFHCDADKNGTISETEYEAHHGTATIIKDNFVYYS